MTDYSLEDLERLWNEQADPMNAWDELGMDEIVHFAQQVARKWQPIETAPQGQWVLLYIPDSCAQVIPGYQTDTDEWSTDLSVTEVRMTDQDYGCRLYEAPTHWMPLPEPPEAK